MVARARVVKRAWVRREGRGGEEESGRVDAADPMGRDLASVSVAPALETTVTVLEAMVAGDTEVEWRLGGREEELVVSNLSGRRRCLPVAAAAGLAAGGAGSRGGQTLGR